MLFVNVLLLFCSNGRKYKGGRKRTIFCGKRKDRYAETTLTGILELCRKTLLPNRRWRRHQAQHEKVLNIHEATKIACLWCPSSKVWRPVNHWPHCKGWSAKCKLDKAFSNGRGLHKRRVQDKVQDDQQQFQIPINRLQVNCQRWTGKTSRQSQPRQSTWSGWHLTGSSEKANEGGCSHPDHHLLALSRGRDLQWQLSSRNASTTTKQTIILCPWRVYHARLWNISQWATW